MAQCLRDLNRYSTGCNANQYVRKSRMRGPPAQHGLQAARKNIMKHTFKIIYETDGMPICPDAIHKQLDLAMDDIKKQFSIQYYTLPGLHKLYLEPCGDWFPEEQNPDSWTGGRSVCCHFHLGFSVLKGRIFKI